MAASWYQPLPNASPDTRNVAGSAARLDSSRRAATALRPPAGNSIIFADSREKFVVIAQLSFSILCADARDNSSNRVLHSAGAIRVLKSIKCKNYVQSYVCVFVRQILLETFQRAMFRQAAQALRHANSVTALPFQG